MRQYSIQDFKKYVIRATINPAEQDRESDAPCSHGAQDRALREIRVSFLNEKQIFNIEISVEDPDGNE